MKLSKKWFFLFLVIALVGGSGFAEAVQDSSALPPRGFVPEVSKEVVPLERNGISLHLALYQAAGAASLKPILLVHGLTYSSHEFDVNYGDYSLTRYLANHGYAVWLLDIAGYGESGAVKDGYGVNSDYAAEDIAAAVRVINRRSGTTKVDILGWSWGTVTGGRFAAKYPDLVDKLVLYAPIVAGLGSYPVPEPFHANDWYHAADDFQKLPDGSIDYRIVEQAVADTFLSNCWRYDGKGSPAGGRVDLLQAPGVRLIPTASIQAPTLLILGDKDGYVSVDLAQEALASLPRGELRVVPGAAHAMMMERPYYKIFREIVLEFLNK